MPYSVKYTEREFTPAEAAEITGVSTALQRDWRRRGILPKREVEGWSKYSVTGLVQLHVLGFFSDAGVSVKQTRDITSAAVLPVLDILQQWDGASEFKGAKISKKLRETIRSAGFVRGASGRYLVVAHRPQITSRDFPLTWCRPDHLGDIGPWLEEHLAEGFTCLDLTSIASRIVEHAGLPLFYVLVEQTK